jgi:hypothetical protein
MPGREAVRAGAAVSMKLDNGGRGGDMTEREDGPLRADAEPVVDESASAAASVIANEEPDDFVPARVGCRTDLRGWAGAHLHGAVRPRRRAAGRGRPPGRWC